jgi:hypothetical protein
MGRVVRTIAVILPCLALLQALANPGDYRRPVAAVVVWLAVLGAGAWLVPRLRAGGLGRAETAAAVAIAVSAVAAVDMVYRPRAAAGGVDLAILGTAWLLVLVVLSNPARLWIPAALLVFTVHGALLIRGQGLNPVGLSQLAAAAYIIAAMLILFAALRQVLDTRVAMVARQASLASRSAAERAAAAAVTSERRGRLAVLEQEALPLLRAIADGTLDAADESVRARCARHAAALRHSIAGHSIAGHSTAEHQTAEHSTVGHPVAGHSTGENSAGEHSAGGRSVAGGGQPDGGAAGAWQPRDGLVAGLSAVLRAAAARDLLVTVQVMGDLAAPPAPVVRAAAAAAGAVLSELPAHEVLLTVIGAGDETELYLTFGLPLRSVPDLTRFGEGLPAATRWRAEASSAEDGGCLEMSWRYAGAG